MKLAGAFLVAGWLLILAGLWRIYPPAASIAFGVLLVARGAHMGRSGVPK